MLVLWRERGLGKHLYESRLHDLLEVRVLSEIDEILLLHGMQQRHAQLLLLNRDEQGVNTVPQTASDCALSETVAEDVFEKAMRCIGKLLSAVDECVPLI